MSHFGIFNVLGKKHFGVPFSSQWRVILVDIVTTTGSVHFLAVIIKLNYKLFNWYFTIFYQTNSLLYFFQVIKYSHTNSCNSNTSQCTHQKTIKNPFLAYNLFHFEITWDSKISVIILKHDHNWFHLIY